jgi:hypothetical protein
MHWWFDHINSLKKSIKHTSRPYKLKTFANDANKSETKKNSRLQASIHSVIGLLEKMTSLIQSI